MSKGEAKAESLNSNHVSALREVAKQNWSRISYHQKRIEDPLVLEIMEWVYLTQSPKIDRNFEDIQRFLENHRQWPLQKAVRLAAEEKMPQSLTAQQIIAWFERYPPLTMSGALRYIRALQAVNPQKANSYIREYWRNRDMDIKQQQDFLRQFDSYLSVKDHEERLDYLVWEGEFKKARLILKLVELPYRLLISARIKLAEMDVAVDQAVSDIPSQYQNDAGLIYERARWRRKKDMDDAAAELLKIPVQQVKRPDLMWKERSVLVRRFLEKRQFQKAYDLVSRHYQKEGFAYVEAEWMAGWLSLNFLNEPMRSFRHFYAMYEKVSTPLSKSRGAYWAGLASLKVGDQGVAKQWLAVASRYSVLFYGQLATVKLREIDPDYKISLLPVAPNPTWQDRQLFYQKDFVKVIQYLHAAGFTSSKDVMYYHLVDQLKRPVDYSLLAELATVNKDYHVSIQVAKKALAAGVMMLDQGYPILTEDSNRYLNGVEKALVHALIRQESAFKLGARSAVGAEGLMQLMKGTARDMSRSLGVPFYAHKLSSDQRYNVQLGSRYLQMMLKKYEGYYPMAIAAYNAGPGRMNSIIKQIGDPRKGDISMVDWIEMIPVYETRNYVHRVLEALHVYRIKFSDDVSYAHNVRKYEGSTR